MIIYIFGYMLAILPVRYLEPRTLPQIFFLFSDLLEHIKIIKMVEEKRRNRSRSRDRKRSRSKSKSREKKKVGKSL